MFQKIRQHTHPRHTRAVNISIVFLVGWIVSCSANNVRESRMSNDSVNSEDVLKKSDFNTMGILLPENAVFVKSVVMGKNGDTISVDSETKLSYIDNMIIFYFYADIKEENTYEITLRLNGKIESNVFSDIVFNNEKVYGGYVRFIERYKKNDVLYQTENHLLKW